MFFRSLARSFAKFSIAFAILFAIVGALDAQTALGQPEINVERPALTTILDGDTDAQGNVAFGSATTITYTVRNTGSSNLTLSDFSSSSASNVTVNNIDPSGFGSLIITSGGTREFDVTYTVSSAGAFSFELDIASDDADEANYDITVSGTGVNSPEIDVEVFDGALTPVANGGSTDVGNRNTNFTFSDIFIVVENNGTSDLNVTNVSSSNANNITITGIGIGSSTIVPNDNSTINFDYEVNGLGAFSFDVTIDNDDADEDPYVIRITGTGIATNEISVERPEGNTIADDGTDPQGNVPSGSSFSQSLFYTVRNTGTGTLNVSGTNLNFVQNIFGGSATPQVFSLDPEETQVLEVSYAVSADGPFELEIEISNDSFDNTLQTYTISVTGTGVTGPEIDVQRPAGTSIPDGDTDAVSGATIGSPTTLTYTVENTGNQTLNITNITSASPSNVTVDNITPTSFTVASGGGTQTFDVTITPTDSTFSFELDITNDDSDEGNYDITVNGSGGSAGAAGSGDVDGNGEINVIDARICLQIAEGEFSATTAQREACDVNNDTFVTKEDAEIIAEFAIGLRGSLAVLSLLAGLGIFLGLPLMVLFARKRRTMLNVSILFGGLILMMSSCGIFAPGTTGLIATITDNYIYVSVTNMPGGGLASFSADAGGFTFDPSEIQATSVQALDGFELLASQIDNATGEVRFAIANASMGVVHGTVLRIGIVKNKLHPSFWWSKGSLILGDSANAVIPSSEYEIHPGN